MSAAQEQGYKREEEQKEAGSNTWKKIKEGLAAKFFPQRNKVEDNSPLNLSELTHARNLLNHLKSFSTSIQFEEQVPLAKREEILESIKRIESGINTMSKSELEQFNAFGQQVMQVYMFESSIDKRNQSDGLTNESGNLTLSQFIKDFAETVQGKMGK